jgi:hypothetical protein
MPSPASLFASILFGAIGLGAFIFGKKSSRWQPMVLGVALMGYPYFVSQTWLLYAVGGALCAGLYLFRD